MDITNKHEWHWGSKITLLTIAIVAGLCLSACSSSSTAAPKGKAALEPISIGIVDGSVYDFVPAFTQAEGFFKDYGLTSSLFKATSGPALETAVVGGSAEFSDLAPTIAFTLIRDGADLEFLINNYRIDYSLLARPGVVPSGVSFPKSMSYLKGKDIGVSALGSITNLYAEKLVSLAGLAPNAVSYVAVGTAATAIPALDSGKIQALVSTAPYPQLIGSKNYTVVAPKSLTKSLYQDYLYAMFGTTKSYASSHPTEVKNFCLAMTKSYKFIANPANDGVVERFLAKYMNMSEAQAKSAWLEFGGNFIGPKFTESEWNLQKKYGIGASAGYVPSWSKYVNSYCAGL